MTTPLYVLEDERGDLYLSNESTCRESTSPVVLEDDNLWDEYVHACRAMNRLANRVRSALKIPPRPVTPETLTMRQIADVKRWAADNGRKGLHADAVRCESRDAPLGAMRRICKHINDTTTRPTQKDG